MNPRVLRLTGPAILAGVALLALIAGLIYAGGAAPPASADPGAGVRWGLPIATLALNLAAAGMTGSLVLALFALRPGSKSFDTALTAASVSAAIFTLASATSGFLTFVTLFRAAPATDVDFGGQLGRFLLDAGAGRAWALATVAGAVLTVLTFAVRTWTSTVVVAVLAAAALIPVATQGDAAGGETARLLHIVAAAVWLGGAVLLVLIRAQLDREQLADVLTRYASVAVAAFVVVALSGLARSAQEIAAGESLLSPYGALLMVKVLTLLGLGAWGAWYRPRLIGRIRADAPASRFWVFITLELAFLGLASGAAVALTRTAPPVAVPTVPTPAEVLTGSVLPPELTLTQWLTAVHVDLLWAIAAGFGLFFYLAGARRCRLRGERWPLVRTLSWVSGMLLLLWVTSGPIGAYQPYLFSMNMAGHMLLSLAIPALLVAGAPVTLAERAIRPRQDGTRGGREWILWAVRTPVAHVLTHPLFAAALFGGSLWAYVFTDLFRWSLEAPLFHDGVVAYVLMAGYLFVQSLIGTDRTPVRLRYRFRLMLVLIVLATLVALGLAITRSSGLFVADWFGSMGRTWGSVPLEDQRVGAIVAGVIGAIPMLAVAGAVALQWRRHGDPAEPRSGQQRGRAGAEELDAYNAQLAALADRAGS